MTKLYKLDVTAFYNRENNKGLPSNVTFSPHHMHATVVEEKTVSEKEAKLMLGRETDLRLLKDEAAMIEHNGVKSPKNSLIAFQAGTVETLAKSYSGKIDTHEIFANGEQGLGGTAHFEEEARQTDAFSPIQAMGRSNRTEALKDGTEFLFWDGCKSSKTEDKEKPTNAHSVTATAHGWNKFSELFNSAIGEEDGLAVASGTIWVGEDTVSRVFCGADNLHQALAEQKKYGGEYSDKMTTGHVYHVLDLGQFKAENLTITPIDTLYLRDTTKSAKDAGSYKPVYCSERMPDRLRSRVEFAQNSLSHEDTNKLNKLNLNFVEKETMHNKSYLAADVSR